MPQYTLNRAAVLRTTGGSSFKFEPGKPVNIPQIFEADVISMGGQLVGGSSTPFIEVDGGVRTSVPLDEREALVRMAFADILAKNDSRDFAGSAPSIKAVIKYSGIELDRGELADYWQAFKLATDK